MTVFIQKGGFVFRHTNILCEDEGRDQGDASTTLTVPANHRKLGVNHGTDSSSQSSQGNKPCWHLGLRFTASTTWEYASLKPLSWCYFVMVARAN